MVTTAGINARPNTVELGVACYSEACSVALPPCGGGLGWGDAIARKMISVTVRTGPPTQRR
jgi:hypothetical protein